MKVIGIDQSGEMLALARKKIRLDAKNGQVNFMKSSLPLPEDFSNQLANKVELILCSSVLEYISNFEEVLAQCYCMLKTDGKMIVSFPNRRSLYRSGERILKRLPIWKNSYLQYQKHQFEQNQIAGLMNRMSFKLLHTEYFALPFQRFLGHLLGASRHPRIATMFVVVIQKY
jgi:ubiquinone/menaquinone biosynthesis C-methylase UbiE